MLTNCYSDGVDKGIHLTHWGRVTHICISKLTIIVSDNGLSPGCRQAIIWTNAGILLIGPLGTNFNETSIKFHTFSFKKIHLKMSSAKGHLFRLSRNELTVWGLFKIGTSLQIIFSSYVYISYCKFILHRNLFLGIQLTISQHCFRYLLDAEQAPSHYLNQYWPWSIMPFGIIRPQWVNLSDTDETINIPFHFLW